MHGCILSPMPRFKTTQNIFKDYSEFFDENWSNHSTIQLPPKKDWDYSRELNLEDVDLWEVLYEGSGTGVYAAWSPYAEFYLAKVSCCNLETFYGVKAQERLKKYLVEYGINLHENLIWKDPEEMWLYK